MATGLIHWRFSEMQTTECHWRDNPLYLIEETIAYNERRLEFDPIPSLRKTIESKITRDLHQREAMLSRRT